jgi:hypothetical protein
LYFDLSSERATALHSEHIFDFLHLDLGLAKGAAESKAKTALSIPGRFAGTPEFASPDSGLTKYDILREVMVQFRVHALRVKPSPDAKPPIV